MAHYSQKWWYPDDSGSPAANQRAIVFTDNNVLATIYSDAGMTTPIANPTLTNSIGVLDFYVPDASGVYFIFVGPTAVGDSQQWNSGGSLDSPVLTINNVPPDLSGNSTVTAAGVGAIPSSLLDAKGDIIAASADNTPSKVSVGANGTVLTADSSAAGGVSWQATSGGDVTGPASSVDDSVPRFDGTTGKVIQGSSVRILDAGSIVVSGLSSPPAYADGQLHYSIEAGTLVFDSDSSPTPLHIGHEVRLEAHNFNGFTIPKGSAVYINGNSGAPDYLISIDFSQANDGITTESIGVALDDIGPDSNGFVLVEGHIEGIDTSAFFQGEYVYLSATTPGGLVANPPHQPNWRNVIGIISNVDAVNGSMVVFPTLARTGYGGTNQYLALDTGGTNQQYRSLLGTAGHLTVTHSSTAATFDVDPALVTTINGKVDKSTLSAKGSLIAASAAATPVDVPVGADGLVLTADSTQTAGVKWSTNGAGDVVGPGSATDNAITRFDGVTGKIIQSSQVTLNDDGIFNLPTLPGPFPDFEGDLYADENSGALTYRNEFFASPLDRQTYVRVHNSSGASIAAGTPVYVTGHINVYPYPVTIEKAQANSLATSKAIGLTAHIIADGSDGYVIVEGTLAPQPTPGWNPGDYIYVSPTIAGTITTTKPSAPNYAVCLGQVGVVDISHGSFNLFRTEAAVGLGSANQVRGINAAGTAEENKTLQGTSGRLTVTNSTGAVTFDVDPTLSGSFLQKTANLSDVASAATSRTNLGVPPTTRLITTTNGITGGGDLSTDRTLQPVYGTTAGTVTEGNDSRVANAVQNTRLITTTNGITGGGDLSADRTIQPVYGTTSGTVTQGNDTRVVNAVQNTRLITTTNGITGGGDLSTNRTIQPVYGTTAGTVTEGNDTRVTGAQQRSTLTTKGDLFVATASATTTRQPVGSNGQFLTADSAQTTGVSWTTATAASVGAVPTTRLITTTNGITGGGDLSADRTLQPVYGTTSGTVAAGDDSRITGAVQGPASATDSAIALFNGGTGKLVKNSNVLISSTGTFTFPVQASAPASASQMNFTGKHLYLNYNDSATFTVDLGQQQAMYVQNNSGADINGASLVYITGNTGSPNFTPTIGTSNSNSVLSAKVTGITVNKINDGSDGFIVTRGIVNANTSALAVGDIAYLSGAGLSSNAPSTSNIITRVGTVVNVGTTPTGLINLRPEIPRIDLSAAINPFSSSLGAQPAGGIAVARTNAAITLNQMYLLPVVLMRTATLNSIQIEVTGTTTSSVTRAGLYASNQLNTPTGSPLVDFGTVATDTTGVKSWTVNQLMAEGTVYYIALVGQVAATGPNLRLFTGFNGYVPTSGGLPTGTNAGWNVAWTQTGVSGALPAIGSLSTSNAPVTALTFV